jgi:multimeric flavodoxin WrbA
MKVTVLMGSPKGEASVTLQYVRFIQKVFPRHELDIIHVAERIRGIERDEQVFGEIIDRVRDSDGVLWAFPLYVMLVHGNYKRFIELIWERGAQDAFTGKYAATLSTSIHFYDHTAHNYMRGICDDLGMRTVGTFSADMPDLLDEGGQKTLTLFAEAFFEAIESQIPVSKRYAPIVHRKFDYQPEEAPRAVDPKGKKVLIVTDAQPHQVNLTTMIDQFKAAFAQEVDTANLWELDIKGGCLGCIRCGYDNQCVYGDKDGYIEFFNTRLKTADVIVFAGAIRDRYLSSRWKTFFDRSFFNNHTPALTGKQFGVILSGPLSQIPNLEQILEAWIQLQHSNLAGFVTDEYGSSAEIDGLTQELAERLIRFAEREYMQPQTFLAVGGTKLFRDAVWGPMRTVFQADHRAYKRMGVYDFPQKHLKTRATNVVMSFLLRIPRFRKEFTSRIVEGMVSPYRRVVEGET